jgi:GT2 family glycosyltransferase
MPDPTPSPITVGIVTRNRPESLARCLASLSILGDRLVDAIVVDDAGTVPLDAAMACAPAGRARLIRQEGNRGPIAARNTIMREARTETVLLLDDDAALLPGGNLDAALRVFEAHPRIGSVACAMAEVDGSAWHASMQPAPVEYTCYVTAYIGFAHLVRRSVFLGLGGYREAFYFYGEEKDLCLRMLDAGFDVVYTPQARVIHTPDPSGRNRARYVRYAIRNDCLFALYNEPWPMAIVSVPIRLSRYFRMIRGIDDPGGFRWILSELWRALPGVRAGRRPVTWATVRQWRRLGRSWPAFA